jgi:L-ascorbate metabolism protein UlaG (beta-lactamase superfamily)
MSAVAEAARTTAVASGQVALTWLGQAGFLIGGSGGVVAVDPFLSDHPGRLLPAPVRPADLSFVDAVLCTHEHLDHLDLPTVTALVAAAPQVKVIVPAPIAETAAAAGVPETALVPAVPGTPVELPATTVHPVPACHGVDVADAYNFGPVAGEYRYLGYVLDVGGMRVFHAGDTLWYEGMPERLRALGVEVALLPINGRDPVRERDNVVGNLDHREAALLAAEAGARVVVPMHYEMMRGNRGFPAHLVDVVRTLELDLEVVIPRHGKPLVLTSVH